MDEMTLVNSHFVTLCDYYGNVCLESMTRTEQNASKMRESSSRAVISPLAVFCKRGYRTWIDCVAHLKRMRAGAARQSKVQT